MENIDAWFYINLEESFERRLRIEKELINTKKIVRIPAVKHVNTKIGCALSHLKAIEEAKNLNLGVVAILEDDFMFENKDCLDEQLQTLFSVDFDGAELWISPNGKPYLNQLNKALYKCYNTVGKVGYILKRAIFEKAIFCFQEAAKSNIACDISLWSLQRNSFWITTYPYIGKHEEGYSTIEKIFRKKINGYNPQPLSSTTCNL
jgi:GR25 family glycosyltransferase involved in LPS biosynthesis